MADSDMRRWALKGADQRLLEIAEEAARIYASFPELRDREISTPRRRGPGRPRQAQQGGNQPGRARKRRSMSKEARKRISDAQKARWAKHRAAKG